MNTLSSSYSRVVRFIAALLLLGCSVMAQSIPGQSGNTPANNARPTIPAADKLTRFGQVATPAEAKPLIEKYYADQEVLFQERRAAILSLQGKSPEEKLKIMRALVAAQQEKRRANRELHARISAMLKQDQESRQPGKGPVGIGR